MCPHCRAFITTDDKVCPYCDTPVGPRAIDERSPDALVGGLIPHARFVTVLILLINSGLYAATMVVSLNGGNQAGLTDIDSRTLYLFGSKISLLVWRGEYWRLVTAGFLHAGLLHIAMNSWVLFDVGANVEEVFGGARMVTMYFVSTVTGFLASAWWSPAPSVGASAGIFGLIGAMIAYGSTHRSFMAQTIKTHYSRWAVYGLLIGLLGFLPIDNAAHVGGLAGGFATAYLSGTPGARVWREKLWAAAAAVSVALTLLSFAEALLPLFGASK